MAARRPSRLVVLSTLVLVGSTLACGVAALRSSGVDRASSSARADAGALAPHARRVAELRAERATILRLVRRHRPDWDDDAVRHVAQTIHSESIAANVDPLLVCAIVARESSFRSNAVSYAGAVGLMQLRPFVAADVAERGEVAWTGVETLHTPELNVRLGIRYFSELLGAFQGDVRLALMAYHRGPTRLRRQMRDGSLGGSRYADDVLALYRELDARRAAWVLERG